MFLFPLLLLALAQIPDAPKPKAVAPQVASQALELQGDMLGESLETFEAQHPKALCDTSQARVVCYQWVDVAIFGMTAHIPPGCTLKKRYAADCLQGISARFTDHKLASLVYTLAGTDKTAAAEALRKQLGSPTSESREGVIWSTANGNASVVVLKNLENSEGPSMLSVSIAEAN